MSNKIKALIGIILLGIVGAGVAYFYLTQSQSVSLEVKKGEKYRIAGKYYEGKYGDRELEKVFMSIRGLKENESMPGDLAIVYYGDPLKEKGKVKNFVGIVISDTQEVPDTLEIRTFSPEYLITADIHSHPAVMPTPDDIRERMEEVATEKGYELDSIFMEKYLSNEDIVVVRHLSRAGN